MTLGIESLEVEPIVGILQEVTFGVSKEVFPLVETTTNEIMAPPHGFKIPFSSLITALVVDKDKVPLVKGVWVDVRFIMGLRPGLSCFDNLESGAMVLIGFSKHK